MGKVSFIPNKIAKNDFSWSLPGSRSWPVPNLTSYYCFFQIVTLLPFEYTEFYFYNCFIMKLLTVIMTTFNYGTVYSIWYSFIVQGGVSLCKIKIHAYWDVFSKWYKWWCVVCPVINRKMSLSFTVSRL